MHDVMIDLETMSTSQHATICSIGACKFDPNTPNEIGEEFYAIVDWNFEDRDIDMGTVRWWMAQSDGARAQIARTDGIPLLQALADLADFINPNDTVWGNGSTFDISILQDAYEGNEPWEFWNVQDVRTITRVAKGIVEKPVNTGVAHNALDDAIYQARYVSTMYSTLRKACGK